METKTLHIDTLYLSYNCDFQAYLNACEIIADKSLLYYRDGRQFYDFGFARVGWLDWEICQKSKNYPFVVEYNFEYLYQTDLINSIGLKDLLLPFENDFKTYLIKRLDYNYTFKSPYKDILQSIFISPHFHKINNWSDGNLNIETVNLGKRSTGKTFRIYNKSKELSDKKNHIKNDMMKQKFGDLTNLYSLEVELHRKYIISRTGINGDLNDFDYILDLAKTLLASIRYCKNTPRNIALIRSKHYDRIKFIYLLDFIQNIEFLKVKKYDKSKDNLLKAIENILLQYNSYEGERLSMDDLADEILLREEIKEL